jgi:hypothetical protein
MGEAGSSHLATINLAAAHIPPLYKAIPPIPDSSTGLLPQCLHKKSAVHCKISFHVGAENEILQISKPFRKASKDSEYQKAS